mgnify:CR=1 FL=1
MVDRNELRAARITRMADWAAEQAQRATDRLQAQARAGRLISSWEKAVRSRLSERQIASEQIAGLESLASTI